MARRDQESAGASGISADRETTEQAYGVTSIFAPTSYKPGPSATAAGTTPYPIPRHPTLRASPDRLRRNSAGILVPILEEGPYHMEFNDQHIRQFSGSLVVDTDVDDDEEVEEWLLEQELAKEGLYRGASLASDDERTIC